MNVAALPSTRAGALYNAFSYPTKISPESIAVLLASSTQPGAVVLDTFAGSGTTGLAALLCDRPTPRMKDLAKTLGVDPQWGPREAVLYELGTLGAFVSRVLCAPPDPGAFRYAALAVHSRAATRLTGAYAVLDPDGEAGQIRHMIWSEVLECPHCGHHMSFWDAVVRHRPLRIEDVFDCAECSARVQASSAPRVTEAFHDAVLGRSARRRKRVPIRVYGESKGKRWMRMARNEDGGSVGPKDWVPVEEMHWGDLFRSGYHHGITHVHQFYTDRNLAVIAALWAETAAFEPHLRDALRLWILSYNSTHSTVMTRVVVKKDQKDFVLTGAQSGVLYVSGLPVEKNVFSGVRRKVNTFARAFEKVHGSRSKVSVVQASSTDVCLPDGSVDLVFTDPPFGDYIPYAELNQINEAWLGELTDRTEEAIVSPAQGKDLSDYGGLLERVFREMARVLSPSGRAAVVFHSAHAAVWRELVRSFTAAGFVVEGSSFLDKDQSSFKQVVSPAAVKGDPILTLARANGSMKISDDERQIAADVLAGGADPDLIDTERQPERLYARYVTRCLEAGVDVQMDAPNFYEQVRGLATQ